MEAFFFDYSNLSSHDDLVSLNTCASISWSASATTGKEAYSYPEHPIRAIWKWQSRTPRNSDFLAYAHFAFIPGKGDNYFVSLSN